MSLKYIPRPLTKDIAYFITKHSDSAKKIADKLITSSSDTIILPFVDHPGPFSRELLSRNFRSLTICEREPNVSSSFSDHVKSYYPDKNIHVHNEDLLETIFSFGPEPEKRCRHIIAESQGATNRDIERGNFERGKIKFFVPLLKSRTEVGLLRNMFYQVALRKGLGAQLLVDYCYLMSDRQFNHLIAQPGQDLIQYRSSTVLYNNIFDIQKLESFDLKNCFGISLRDIQRTAKKNDRKYQNVHLVSLKPKNDVLAALSPRAWLEFRFFVTQLMFARKEPILSKLDTWFRIPEEGPSQLGITRSTRSGDLSVDQYFELFIYISGRPDYRNSSFLQASRVGESDMLDEWFG